MGKEICPECGKELGKTPSGCFQCFCAREANRLPGDSSHQSSKKANENKTEGEKRKSPNPTRKN